MPKRPPTILAILDGFGEAPAGASNAITLADPAFYASLREDYPFGLLGCSGDEVGLPCGLMGNSEVGHLNIGAGRIVWQEISRIDREIELGSFAKNPAFLQALAQVKRTGGKLHLFGLLSDGGVHSSDQHLAALLDMAAAEGLSADRVLLHAFLDGRDTPPRSAARYLTAVSAKMSALGTGRIATLCGRYYAMDRDQRWDRVERAYRVLTDGVGHQFQDPQAGLEAAYARGEDDEFVLPTVIGDKDQGRVRAGDAVIFFNFRADRARQITDAFISPGFEGFARELITDLVFVTMGRYRQDFDCPVAFAPSYLKGIMPEVVSAAGLTQLRIAETEKYAHVTFFMSGGDERELPGERRILVPSPRVATYDMQPEMSAAELTDALLAELDSENPPDLTILNFANADMVGHTGKLDAAIQSVRTLDNCLARLVPRVVDSGGYFALTADHGNCEMMIDPETGEPHTAHTTNPVPFLIMGEDLKGRSLQSGGRLCDIATTILPLMGLAPHPSMEGVNLL